MLRSLASLATAISTGGRQRSGRCRFAFGGDMESSAYAGPAETVGRAAALQRNESDRKVQATNGKPFRIVGLSQGLSGGADVSGYRLLRDRWVDFFALTSALDPSLIISTGCRLLPGARLDLLLPSCQYIPHGPRSRRYDAVCGFTPVASGVPVDSKPDWTTTSRIQWFQAGHNLAPVGGYVPPLGGLRADGMPGCTEVDRVAVVDELFRQVDSVKRERPHLLVVVYLDLNPSELLLAHFDAQRRKRHMVEWIEAGTSTQYCGRRLAAVCADPGAVLSVSVHNGLLNGSSCRAVGCVRPQCGNHRQTFSSADLDHFATEILCAPLASDPSFDQQSRPTFVTVFRRDPKSWRAAIVNHSDSFMARVGKELEEWTLHAGTWCDTIKPEREEATGLASWLWRSATIFAGLVGGQVQVRPRPRITPPLQQPKVTPAHAADARGLARAWARTKETERDVRLMELLRTDPPRADAYISSLVREPSMGLPGCMEDPVRTGGFLVGHGVVDGAAEYIEGRHEKRAACPQVDLAHRCRTVAECECLIDEAWRQACAVWPRDHKPYTNKEWMAAVAKLNAGKCCADVTPAAVIGNAPGQAKCGLAARNLERALQSVAPVLKCQPVHHKLKARRPRAQFESHRTLSPNTLELGLAELLWGGAQHRCAMGGGRPVAAWPLRQPHCCMA